VIIRWAAAFEGEGEVASVLEFMSCLLFFVIQKQASFVSEQCDDLGALGFILIYGGKCGYV
jgi:hypothetical protein